jgi:hypothetical protein
MSNSGSRPHALHVVEWAKKAMTRRNGYSHNMLNSDEMRDSNDQQSYVKVM